MKESEASALAYLAAEIMYSTGNSAETRQVATRILDVSPDIQKYYDLWKEVIAAHTYAQIIVLECMRENPGDVFDTWQELSTLLRDWSSNLGISLAAWRDVGLNIVDKRSPIIDRSFIALVAEAASENEQLRHVSYYLRQFDAL